MDAQDEGGADTKASQLLWRHVESIHQLLRMRPDLGKFHHARNLEESQRLDGSHETQLPGSFCARDGLGLGAGGGSMELEEGNWEGRHQVENKEALQVLRGHRLDVVFISTHLDQA